MTPSAISAGCAAAGCLLAAAAPASAGPEVGLTSPNVNGRRAAFVRAARLGRRSSSSAPGTVGSLAKASATSYGALCYLRARQGAD